MNAMTGFRVRIGVIRCVCGDFHVRLTQDNDPPQYSPFGFPTYVEARRAADDVAANIRRQVEAIGGRIHDPRQS